MLQGWVDERLAAGSFAALLLCTPMSSGSSPERPQEFSGTFHLGAGAGHGIAGK